MNNHPIGCEAFLILRYCLAESFPEILAQSCGFLGFPTSDPFRSGACRKRRLIHRCLTSSNLGKSDSRSSTNRGPCQVWRISLGQQKSISGISSLERAASVTSKAPNLGDNKRG